MPKNKNEEKNHEDSEKIEIIETKIESEEPLSQSAEYHILQDQPSVQPLLSYKQGLKQVFYMAVPNAMSRVSASVNSIGNSIIYAKLGPSAVAAGPLITTFFAVTLGTFRGGLVPTSILIGKLDGEKKYSDIGAITHQSLFLGTVFSIPVISILLNVHRILTAIGTAEDIAIAAQEYFTPFTYGVPATFWYITDIQLALGIKKPKIALAIGASYAILTMAIGYPLALGSFGLPKLGIAGVGHGTSISALLVFTGSKLYYATNKDFRKFNLFTCHVKNLFHDLSKFLKLSLPIAFQFLTEWGNLYSITLITAKLGKNALIAEQVSLQLMMFVNLTIQGLTESTAALISNTLGLSKKLNDECDLVSYDICCKNIRVLGNSGLIIGASLSILICGVFSAIPTQLTSLFVSTETIDEDILALSQELLLINGIGLLVDSTRNVGAGVLAGFKDVMFAPLLSFSTMMITGLSAGYLFSDFLDWGSEWLFITRNAGILLAAAGIMHRWMKKDINIPQQAEQISEPQENYCIRKIRNCFQFFKPKNLLSEESVSTNTLSSQSAVHSGYRISGGSNGN